MKKIVLFLLAAFVYAGSFSQVNITSFASPYTQNFDSLSNDSTFANTHSMNLAGWAIWETGGGAAADGLYKVNNGSRNNGETYSYGDVLNVERALGSIASASNLPHFGCAFENNTGSTIASFSISFVGEQWRSGDTVQANVDSLILEYSTIATGINDSGAGVWTEAGSLMLLSPNPNSLTTGALNGNDPLNKVNMAGSVNVTVPAGSKLYIRWRDINRAGSDDGLAIDDLSIAFIPVNNNKPVLIGVSPVDNATNVPVTTTAVYAKFDKNILVGTGSAKIINITDATTQTILAADCSVVSNDTGMIGTVVLLAEKDYVVQFDSTLFTTMGGTYNSYGIYDNTSWNFDTKTPTGVKDLSANKLNVTVSGTAGDNTTATITAAIAGSVTIETLDALGKRLFSQKADIRQGENRIILDHAQLPAGVYFLRVSGNEMRGSVKFSK